MNEASPAARFAGIIDALCRAVAARGARGALAGPLTILLWLRLRRTSSRFAALVAKIETGTLRPPRPDLRRNRIRKRGAKIPCRFAWLLRPVPEAAATASQLRHFCSDPEVTALMARAENRFGRILRPLCRTIGITPPPALRAAAPNPSKPKSITREIRRTGSKKQPQPPIFRARHPSAPPASIPAAAMKRHPRDPARAPPIFV